MMPTRLPPNSMPSFGQRCVWHDWPVKLSMPGMVGITAAERKPIGGTRKRVEWRVSRSPLQHELPAERLLAPVRGGDAAIELDVAPQVEFVGDIVEIALGVGLG